MPTELLLHAHVVVAEEVRPLPPKRDGLGGMLILRGDARIFAGRAALAVARAVRASEYVPGQPLPGLVEVLDYADLDGWSAVRLEMRPRAKPDHVDEVYTTLCGLRAGTHIAVDFSQGTRMDNEAKRMVISQTIRRARVLAHPQHVSLTPDELLAQLDRAPEQFGVVQASYVPVEAVDDEEAELLEERQSRRGRRTPPPRAGDGELFPAGADASAEAGGGEG